MPELIGMADRIMVMCDGRVTGFIDGKMQPRKTLWNLQQSSNRRIVHGKENHFLKNIRLFKRKSNRRYFDCCVWLSV